MTDEFALVRNHFIAALEKEGLEAQLRYVAEQCGDTPELLVKLEEMIRAHHQTEGFLASESDGTLAELDTSEKVGGRIGPYKLLHQIGEGGMGVVYMAEQTEPVERRVALKIIKPGMDSRQVIARFEAERQALAMMEHPNIARVLDAGTTAQGHPFFAMELVNGLSITKFCDQRRFNARQRLELFVPVCQAVQHAHQKGVIHRDLKPSNILVAMYDELPVPKVIDFGVAKAVSQRLTEKTMFTALGQIIGTLEYMSPEQAQQNQLDVDTRSDVYSLGVVLYELLAGDTPFDRKRLRAAAFEELLRIIREEESPRPSSKLGSSPSLPAIAANRRIEPRKLSLLVKGDLDWVVMKALAKDRAQRYETANGLSRDVQRYLEGEAVVARPPTWSYLGSRFVRRNRGLVWTAVSILGVLLMGLVTSLVLAAWALNERAHAKLQESAANVAEQNALDSLLEARLAFASLNVWSGKPGQQRESLAAIGEAAGLARRNGTFSQHVVELRSKAIAAMSRADTHLTDTIATAPEAVTESALALDLKTLAFRIREPEQDFVTIRDVAAPTVERMRIAVPFNTRSAFHDQVLLNLSATGRYLSIFCAPYGVLLWDVKENRKLALFKRATEPGCFSPNEKYFVVGIFDQSTQSFIPTQFELPAMREVRRFETQVLNNALAISHCGRYLASSTAAQVNIHDVASGKQLATLALASKLPYHEIAWSRSSRLLAVTVDNDIHIFDVTDSLDGASQGGQTLPPIEVTTLRGSESYVNWIRFHPVHESLLVSGGWDGTLRLWNVFSGGMQLSFAASRPEFSSDGQRLKVTQFGGVEIHEFRSGETCRWITGQGQRQVAFDPSQRILCMASDASGCQLWSMPGLEPLGRLCPAPAPSVAWSSADHSLLVGNDNGLFEFPVRVENSKLRVGPSKFVLSNFKYPFWRVHVSHDAQHVVAYELQSLGPVILDRRRAAAKKWLRPQQTNEISLAPNGRWFCITYADRAVVTDFGSMETVAEFPLASYSGVAFSADSQLLVISSTNRCQFIRTDNWELVGAVNETVRMFEPAISTDDKLAVVPTGTAELGVFETSTLQLLAKLKFADAPRLYTAANFNSNSDWLCVAHESNGATLWDIRKIREQLATLGLDWQLPLASSPPIHAQAITTLEIEPGEYEEFVQLIELEDKLEPQAMYDAITSRIDSGADFADAFALRARSLIKLNDHLSAIDEYEQIRLRAPYVGNWRVDEADSRQQVGDFEGALEIFRELSDPTVYENPTYCFVRACRLVATHPELVSSDDQFAADMRMWSDACRGVDTDSHLALIIQALPPELQTELRESIGLAYVGLGDDAAASPLLKAQ